MKHFASLLLSLVVAANAFGAMRKKRRTNAKSSRLIAMKNLENVSRASFVSGVVICCPVWTRAGQKLSEKVFGRVQFYDEVAMRDVAHIEPLRKC